MAALTYCTVAALALAASACRVTTGFSSVRPVATATATASSSTTAPGADGPSPAEPSSIAASSEPPNRNGMIFQAEMAALTGLTPDQARMRLKELGHFGPVITVELEQFLPDCQQGRVCGAAPAGGTFVHAEITLSVNKPKLAIPAPPP